MLNHSACSQENDASAELEATGRRTTALRRSPETRVAGHLVHTSFNQTSSSDTSMQGGRRIPLLICSVGNPGPTYANTLHSAAHTVLNRLADALGRPSSFGKDRALGNGLVTSIGNWTLWQSPSYMNDSGKGVRAAWQKWSRSLGGEEGRLVVVHDELEKPLGSVTLRTAKGASAKGHNGLKSILSLMGDVPFARIGIGIGRPASRESTDVANYVLRKMTPAENETIEGSVEQVIAKLDMVEHG